LPRLRLEEFVAIPELAKFELLLTLSESRGAIAGKLIYAQDLYDDKSAERMVLQMQVGLERMVENSEIRIGELSLLTEAERRVLIEEWNETSRDYGEWKSLDEIILEQARESRDAVAVESEEGQLSYGEMVERAERLSGYLQSLGIGPEKLVGVCVRRGLEMVVSLLGILQARGAYVPLDPDYPDERLAHMLLDSRAAIVLTQEKLLDKLTSLVTTDTRLVALDRQWSEIDDRVAGSKTKNVRLGERGEPHHLAYVIYTSGSTGQPKGVMNEHRGVVNRLIWMHRAYGLDREDAVLQKTPYSFDVSVWEFFWPLLAG